MRENQEINISENGYNNRGLANQDSQYSHSQSMDSNMTHSLFYLKMQNDLQRKNSATPAKKKKTLFQKFKEYLSNEINWQEMPERNIVFNANPNEQDYVMQSFSPQLEWQNSADQEVEKPVHLQLESNTTNNNNINQNNKQGIKQPLLDNNNYNQQQKQQNYQINDASPSPSKSQLGSLQSMNVRRIKSNTKKTKSEFCSNRICTSKYTLLNFLFLNLYEQFTKVANLYFLVMGVFQMIPAISSSEGIPYVYMPLTFIVVVTMIKDIVEDIRRHKSDQKENNYPIWVYRDDRFVLTQSEKVEVGDIVKIKQNHNIPLDLVLLYSSTQNEGISNRARKKGVCYIETKNLDGETSLKSKNVSKSIMQMIDKEEKLFEYEGLLKSEAPNPYLYKYNGSLKLFRKDKTMKDFRRIHVEEDNFVLRGCILRNTEYIIGVATFTGHETKIMLNSNRPRPKKSKVELDMNKEIMMIWLSQMIFCIISSLFGLFWFIENKNSLGYLVDSDDAINNYFVYLIVRYGNWLLIFMNFVPISLLITLDVIRICQALILMKSRKMVSFHKIEYYDDQDNLDKDNIISEKQRQSMKPRLSRLSQQHLQKNSSKEDQHKNLDKIKEHADEDKDHHIDDIHDEDDDDENKNNLENQYTKISPIVQSSNLNEDLGQIKCVFSDKTGTLTCNVMNLKSVVFDGKIYGKIDDLVHGNHNLSEQLRQNNNHENNVNQSINRPSAFEQKLFNYEESFLHVPKKQKIKNVNFEDPQFVSRVLAGNEPRLLDFIEHLAICHTVMYQEIPISQMYRNANEQQKDCNKDHSIPNNLNNNNTVGESKNGSMIKNKERTIGTYQSASPDELALVNFAKMCGCEFKGHDENDNISILQKSTQPYRSSTSLEQNSQAVFQANKHGSFRQSRPSTKNMCSLFKNFKILNILHFTSERKRMSVIIENAAGEIVLLVKGADQVIVPKLEKKRAENRSFTQQEDEVEVLKNNLHTLSEKGLRTLVMAKRILNKEYYMQWQHNFEEAQNIVGEQKEIMLNELMDEMEQNLTLLGATGIEDKLQKDVQDTIISLKTAGMTVWILTGDKRETAINIALSSKIVEQEKIIEIFETDINLLEQQLVQIKKRNETFDRTVSSFVFNVKNLSNSINKEEDGFESHSSSENDMSRRVEQISSMHQSRLSAGFDKAPNFGGKRKSNFKKNNQQVNLQGDTEIIKNEIIDSENNGDDNQLEFYMSNKAYSLVVEGYSLDLIMKSDERIQNLFQDAIKQASSIVACRVSPKQKQQLVQLYKQFFPRHRTLAIGDGANDVNMLTEAHVGIGIQGLEGLQAARASDFAIGEFRLLKRLLLVHGRECYRKNSTVILYNFYKNIVYLIPLFWFGIYSGFSGSFIYDQFLYQCFNTFFTSLPIVIYAILDKDLSTKVLLTVPYFYRMGIQNRYFNTSTLWQWFFTGVFQSFVISLFSIFIMTEFTSSMKDGGVIVLGQVMFSISIIIVNAKVLIFSNTQYLINIIVCILSFILYILGALMFNHLNTNMLYLEFSKLVKEPQTYYTYILILMLTCLLDYGHTSYMKCDYLKQVQNALQLNPKFQQHLVDSTLEQLQQFQQYNNELQHYNQEEKEDNQNDSFTHEIQEDKK